MADVPPEALTAAAVAIHDADCPDRKCSDAALGNAYRLARVALGAAEPHILAPVYEWLARELGYPFDMTTDAKPPWLDVTRLAEVWAAKDGETAEVYRDAILSETGWADEVDAGPLCDECGLVVCICAGGETDG